MNLRGLQFLTLLAIGSLFALTGLRQFFVEPLASESSNLIWFGIQVLPLLLVLPGVLRLTPRSYLFAILAAMLYFCHGVLQTVSLEDRVMGLWEVAFSLALVLTASFALRHLRMAAAEAEGSLAVADDSESPPDQ
jgi:uncharacterized membrane protein